MGKVLKYFCVASCVFITAKTVFASACPNGYATLDVEKHIDTYKTFDESTFMKPEDGLCKIGGYVLLDIPDDVLPIYNGFVMGSAVTLCDSGHMANNNGTCIPYTQGTCQTNDDNLATDSASFMAEDNGLCKIGGYVLLDIPEDVYPIYNGFVMGSEITLCEGGFLVNNGSCSTYAPGDCPTNYKDLSLNANTISGLSGNSCASGYQRFEIGQQCSAKSRDAICAKLCSGKFIYTDQGTCEVCPTGMLEIGETGLCYSHLLHLNNDIANDVLYLKSEQETTPSFSLNVGNNVFYANMTQTPTHMTGISSHYLKIRVNDTDYYVCDDTTCGDL